MSISAFAPKFDPNLSGRFQELAGLYRGELLENVVPFWERFSPDRECGGFFTCLDRDGQVYDTDKFIWLQARQVWTFAMLYERLEKKPAWLAMAEHGAKFLIDHGRDTQGRWYFSLDRGGHPLVQPYNIFSDCFAVMAFARLGTATANQAYQAIALETFAQILRRRDDPKGTWSKAVPGTRPMRSFTLPMILSNLSLEMSGLIPEPEIEGHLTRSVSEVMEVFRDPASLLVRENLSADGSLSDTFEGRLINPGHGIEAMWFMMDIARRRQDLGLMNQAGASLLAILEYGWDKQEGGIFAFLDIKGHPTQQLEWDQKLWWVHLEALIACLMAYRSTGDQRFWDWFERLHAYAWEHFRDSGNREWFGYLNRQGKRHLTLKGGKWKGCFHLPRALLRCHQELNAMASNSQGTS
ncbi:MAG: AGE family epimerase/isomerase [candidate division FCPU426 bacterium]